MKYYHVHVNEGNNQGFSVWFESNDTLVDQGIIKEAVKLNKIDADDASCVDVAEETTRQDYIDATK